jgi:hypothetical protein
MVMMSHKPRLHRHSHLDKGEIEKDLKQDPPCHSRACAIQSAFLILSPCSQLIESPDCIQKNNFDESKCRKEVGHIVMSPSQKIDSLLRLESVFNFAQVSCDTTDSTNDYQVDALYECCNAFYKERGDEARCVTCPKPDLLRYVPPTAIWPHADISW